MRKINHNKHKPEKLKFYIKGQPQTIPVCINEIKNNFTDFKNNVELKSQNFRYYSNLKDSVIKVTNGKCAYCGVDLDGSAHQEIEHYRPKTGVDVKRNKKIEKPGYFWIASDWYNLFPSCQDCNKEKNREIYDFKSNSYIQRKVGKGNNFPLYKGQKNVCLDVKPDNFDAIKKLKNEKPLLFNPNIINPNSIFDYSIIEIDLDAAIIIIPKKNLSPYHLEMAKTSIDIYALNSRKKALDRYKTYGYINEKISNIKSILKSYDPDDFKCSLVELYRLIDEDKRNSFIGMIEHYFAKDVSSIEKHIDTLGNYSVDFEKDQFYSSVKKIKHFLLTTRR